MRYFYQPGTTRVVKTESARIRGMLKRRGWLAIRSGELTQLMPYRFVKQLRDPAATMVDEVYYFSPGQACYGQTSADDRLCRAGERVEDMPTATGRKTPRVSMKGQRHGHSQ